MRRETGRGKLQCRDNMIKSANDASPCRQGFNFFGGAPNWAGLNRF